MKRAVEFVVRHPWWVLGVTALVTAVLGVQMTRVRMVIDPKTILPQHHPYVQLNNVIEEVFGGSRVVVVGIVAKHGDIFTPEILATIKTLTDEVKKIPGIKEENVISLADRKVKFVTANGDAIEVQRLMPEVPKTPEEIAAFKRRIFSNDLYLKSLISEDGRAAAIITDFREWVPTWQDNQGQQGAAAVQDSPKNAGGAWQSNPEDWNSESWLGGGRGAIQTPYGFRMGDDQIRRSLLDVTARYASDDVEIHLGGMPIALSYLELDSKRIVYLFPIALVVMMLVLYWAFRSVQGMALPLLTALVSVVWALGLMGFFRIAMDPFNTMTPILIMAIAAGHAVQILKRYYEELAAGRDNRRAVVEATAKMAPVMITAGLVAAASFASLVTFHLKTFQAFGVLTAFGIISALILELTFIPALRSLIPAPSVVRARRDGLDRLLATLADVVTGPRRGWVAVGVVVVAVAAIGGASRVQVNNSLKNQFFESTALRIDERALNAHFAGTSTFYVMVEGQRPDALKRPEVVALRKMNRTFHGDLAEFDRIPTTEGEISNFLFMYSISGNPADFARLVDYRYRRAVIWAFLKSDSTALAERLIGVVDAQRAAFERLGVTIGVAGSAPVTVALNRTMVDGKLQNIVQIAAIIFVAAAVVLRSLLGAFLVLVPLGLAVLINFAVMGFTGVTLGIGTAAISAMAVGMGADYAIYFLFRLREEYRDIGGSYGDAPLLARAVRTSVSTSGKAICYVAAAISAGYLILPFSGYYLHMEGILVPIAMVTSALGALIMLPLMIVGLHPGFIVGARRVGDQLVVHSSQD
ncbi:MAG: MMPL family transporter [Nitrospirae bacterium]|nr:MMPL family transporter [Nitrospirota bacterium]